MLHYLNQKQSGFTLFVMLFFINVFFIFITYSLLSISYMKKLNQHAWNRVENEVNADIVLQWLENRLSNEKAFCLTAPTETSFLTKQNTTWWQQHACFNTDGENHYYFLIEFLGNDNCAFIYSNNNQLITADYYRITLLYIVSRLNHDRIFRQETFIKGNDHMPPCTNETHQVMLGPQTKREIG